MEKDKGNGIEKKCGNDFNKLLVLVNEHCGHSRKNYACEAYETKNG